MGELIWTRRYPFASVHRLADERRHGHQYYLEVSVSGRDLNSVDRAVAQEVLERFDGREISVEPQATGEVLVETIHARLADVLGARLRAVALQETRKNRFVSSRSEARYV